MVENFSASPSAAFLDSHYVVICGYDPVENEFEISDSASSSSWNVHVSFPGRLVYTTMMIVFREDFGNEAYRPHLNEYRLYSKRILAMKILDGISMNIGKETNMIPSQEDTTAVQNPNRSRWTNLRVRVRRHPIQRLSYHQRNVVFPGALLLCLLVSFLINQGIDIRPNLAAILWGDTTPHCRYANGDPVADKEGIPARERHGRAFPKPCLGRKGRACHALQGMALPNLGKARVLSQANPWGVYGLPRTTSGQYTE
ncbi:hypothetical protein Syun_001592 [Stephania yunnanensis]|uniref:Uncharacterized protein n=1 Tax=Stephania yunnanensis TaxID=152371 RepID=A0AAP0LE05_9MAGN